MGEEFYSVIKLVTGEEIFALVSIDENDGDPVLIMQNPVTMKLTRTAKGSMLRVKPWMEIATDDFFIIKLDKVITITEVTDENIIEFYNRYLEDEDDDSELLLPQNSSVNKSELTKGMGYIGSVEEARKILEKIYKDLKES